MYDKNNVCNNIIIIRIIKIRNYNKFYQFFIIEKLLQYPIYRTILISPPLSSSLFPSPLYKSVNPIPFARSFLWDSLDLLFVIVYMIMSFRARGSPSPSLSLFSLSSFSSPFPFPTPRWDCEIVFWQSCILGQGSPERSERRGQVQCEKEVFCTSSIIRQKPQLSHYRTLTSLTPTILLHKESVHVTLTWRRRKRRKRERERGRRKVEVERTEWARADAFDWTSSPVGYIVLSSVDFVNANVNVIINVINHA